MTITQTIVGVIVPATLRPPQMQFHAGEIALEERPSCGLTMDVRALR
jgi:hypothetical protein